MTGRLSLGSLKAKEETFPPGSHLAVDPGLNESSFHLTWEESMAQVSPNLTSSTLKTSEITL